MRSCPGRRAGAPAGRPASRYAGQPARASAAPALDHGTFCKKMIDLDKMTTVST